MLQLYFPLMLMKKNTRRSFLVKKRVFFCYVLATEPKPQAGDKETRPTEPRTKLLQRKI